MKLKIKTLLPCLLVTSTLPSLVTSCGNKQQDPSIAVEDWWRLNYVYNDAIVGERKLAQFQFELKDFEGGESVNVTLINQKDEAGQEGTYVEFENGPTEHIDVTDQETHVCNLCLTDDEYYKTGKEYSFVAKAVIVNKEGEVVISTTDTLYIEVAKPTLPTYFTSDDSGMITGFADSPEIEKCSLLAIPNEIRQANGNTKTIIGIADNAFYKNDASTIPQNIKYLLLDSSWGTNPTLTTIGKNAFRKSQFAGECYIPKSVVTIGNHAFSYSKITGLHFGDDSGEGCSLTTIAANAFDHTSIATDIIIPEGCKSIGASAFEDCRKLMNVQIPISLESIGDYAFFQACWGRQGKVQFIVPKNGSKLSLIGFECFNNCNFGKEFYIPDSCLNIDSESFINANYILEISLPAGITKLNRYAFAGMDRLTKIDLSRITDINDKLFQVEGAEPKFFVDSGSISKKITVILNPILKEQKEKIRAGLVANGLNANKIDFDE